MSAYELALVAAARVGARSQCKSAGDLRQVSKQVRTELQQITNAVELDEEPTGAVFASVERISALLAKLTGAELPDFFAVVDTDGTRMVVWGIGRTEAIARRDATRYECPRTENELIVRIDRARVVRVEQGDIGADDLVGGPS